MRLCTRTYVGCHWSFLCIARSASVLSVVVPLSLLQKITAEAHTLDHENECSYLCLQALVFGKALNAFFPTETNSLLNPAIFRKY